VCVVCVWDSLEWVWESECAAGGFVFGVCVCVWDSLEWGLCLGQFGVGLGESVCVVCVCGTVWSGFGRVSVQQVALCFVCVCWYHVVVSRRN